MESVIKVEHLSESLFVLESSEEFRDSLFSLVYQRAGLLINSIVQKNIDMRDNKSIGMEIRSALENIISFQGRRGTGKTSAMLSVYNALKTYSDAEQKNRWEITEERRGREEPSFVTIDYIDASMLERGEDLLEMIIANMFSKLRAQDAREQGQINYENRMLYEKFSEVFGILSDVKKLRRSNNDLSSLQKLAQVSNSQILVTKVENLIYSYLMYMENKRSGHGGRKEPFLVIAVDDVDMHFQGAEESPFELLETIHRYLMIPNVIILLTYDYQNLCQGCEKHFHELFYAGGSYGKGETEYIKERTVEYLNKVLPNYTRVHMPSLRKRDYEESDSGYVVRVTRDATEGPLKGMEQFGLLPELLEQGYADLPIKRFALLLKASMAGLFYDARGNKRHFSEPLSLRELAQIYVFYGQLKKMIQNNTDEMSKWDVVYKEVMDDLYFRYATEKLNWDEMRQFKQYLDVKIERRSRDIIWEIRREWQKSDVQDFSEIMYVGQKEFSYSYGELLYSLYMASSEGWFSKPLIRCVLDSYTIMLTKLYRNMKISWKKLQKSEENTKQKKKCEEEYRKNKKIFTDIMGASVSSSWSNKLLPRYHNAVSVWGGNTSKEENDNSNIVKIGAIKFTSFHTYWEFELNTEPDAATDEIQKKQLQMIEILCMFFTDIYDDSDSPGFTICFKPNEADSFSTVKEENAAEKDNITEEDDTVQEGNTAEEDSTAKESNKENEEEELEIKGDHDGMKADSFVFTFKDGCYNVLNFVNTLFEGKEYFDTLHNRMKEAWIAYWKRIGRMKKDASKTDAESEIEQFFAQNSVYQEYCYEAWSNKSYGFALPVYSFDMMYNLLKRCFLNQGFLGVIEHDGDLLGHIYYLLNNRLGKLLADEAEYYFGKSNNDAQEDQFYINYIENLFLRYLNNLDKNKKDRELFNEHLRKMLEGIVKGRDQNTKWHIS